MVLGCGEPAATVMAAWVDGVSDDDGNRTVRIYDAGRRDALTIRPDIPGSSLDLLQIGVDGRERGVAVSSVDATVWIERGSGRTMTLTAEALPHGTALAPGFSFTRSGDGVLRAIASEPDDVPQVLLGTLSGPDALRVHGLSPPRLAADNHRWALLQASDAPVMLWAELGGSGQALDGELLAFAYPSDEGEGPVVDALRPLARGTWVAATVRGQAPHYLPGCPAGLCIAPSGRVVHALEGTGCSLWRWSWVDAVATELPTPPEPVALECPGDDDLGLLAALDDDVVVLDDPWRLHVVDLVAGTRTSLPKPAGLLTVVAVDRGRALVVSSHQGDVARIDVEGPRMLSGVQSPCVLRDGFAVSPNGAWVVQSCNGQTGGEDGVDGQIQRISVLGSELYGGVPMRPIAVDDEGNALLYSIGSNDDDGVPRGLFVLTGDGQLTRVDELEPFPGQVSLVGIGGDRVPGRFAVAGPS